MYFFRSAVNRSCSCNGRKSRGLDIAQQRQRDHAVRPHRNLPRQLLLLPNVDGEQVLCPDNEGISLYGRNPLRRSIGTGRLGFGDIRRRIVFGRSRAILRRSGLSHQWADDSNRNARTANQIVLGLRCMFHPFVFQPCALSSLCFGAESERRVGIPTSLSLYSSAR